MQGSSSQDSSRGDPRGSASCDHLSSEGLFLYARDQLEVDAQRALEEHLAKCPECRSRVSTLRWIQEQVAAWGGALFADHVPSESLVRYADARADLPSELRGEIDRHLTLCEVCARDLQLVQEVSESLGGQSAAGAVSSPVISAESAAKPAESPPEPVDTTAEVAGPILALPKPPLSRLLLAWLRLPLQPTPAWTYALIVLLAVPAALGIRSLLGPTLDEPLSSVTSLTAPQILEPRDERAAQDIQRLAFLPSEPLLIEFHVPVLESPGVRYDGRLLASSGQEVWREDDLQSVDTFGTFLLLIDPHGLVEGAYRLVVTEHVPRRTTEEIPHGDGPDSDFEFVFQLDRR